MDDFFALMARLTDASIEPNHARAALQALGELPPFLRSLLVADGTVTMALEAYFDEEIRIATVRQEPIQLTQDIPVLNMRAGDLCYFRQVELRGTSTDRCYAAATSILNKKAIGEALFAQLVDEHVGIGVILRNSAKGSFREVLAIQRGSLLADFDVYRSYRVSLAGVPAILINEEFPLAVYQ